MLVTSPTRPPPGTAPRRPVPTWTPVVPVSQPRQRRAATPPERPDSRKHAAQAWLVGWRCRRQIESGEVPYQLRSIKPKDAARIRKPREKKIAFRYFLLVKDDDPNDTPRGALREWDSSSGDRLYAETYTRDGEWEHTNVRLDIERGSDISNRIVPSDSTTVHQLIESWHRQWK
jgi:hypothetical protein